MYRRSFKRVFDICVASVALVILSPLFLIIMAMVWFSLGTPVIFRQLRPGLHGKPFTLLKFRSMRDLRDAEGNLLPDSARLTRLGRFLRISSLDELPELINVIRGEMSLVGPRPLLMEYLDRYTPEQMRRHEVRPGITGWAQVNGRNAIGWEQKFALDVWYVDHLSFWLDLRILALTVWRVVQCKGVNQHGYATVALFQGTSEGRHQ